MTYKETLQNIIDTLTSALSDAEKFDSGVDAAGKRLRFSSQQAKTELHNYRLSIQEERNSRKSK